MIVLSAESATIWAIILTLVVAGWGMATSVVSAIKGPAWGVSFITRTRRFWLILALAGLVALLVVDPRWLGFVVAYLGASAWWLGSVVQRRTSALLEIGGGHELAGMHQAQVLRWTGYGLGGVAAAVGYAARLAWERFPALAVASGLFAIVAMGAGLFLVIRAQNVTAIDQPD